MGFWDEQNIWQRLLRRAFNSTTHTHTYTYTAILPTHQSQISPPSSNHSAKPALQLHNLRHGLLISLLLLQAIDIACQHRVFLLCQEGAAALCRDEREAHQDIRGGQVRAAQVLAAVGGGLELVLEEGEVRGEVRGQEGGGDVRRDAVGDGADEEGNGRVFDAWCWSVREVW